jgi:hypothetical protein
VECSFRGTGPGLDPDSVGSEDPDPDWESGSRSMQVEIGPQNRIKFSSCSTSLNAFCRGLRRHMTVFDQKHFFVINLVKLVLDPDPDPDWIRTGIQQQVGYRFGTVFSKIGYRYLRYGFSDYGSETLADKVLSVFDRPKDNLTCRTNISTAW